MSTIDELAKAQPDELFKEDPDIVRLTQSHARAHKRLELVQGERTIRAGLGSKIESLILQTRAQIQRANESLSLAVLDDLAEGDLEFPRALDLLASIEDLERVLRVANLAVQIGQTPVPSRLTELVEGAVLFARSRLSSELLDKKREHLKNNPTAVA